jgi:hypothetical protein
MLLSLIDSLNEEWSNQDEHNITILVHNVLRTALCFVDWIRNKFVVVSTEPATILVFLFHPVHYISIHHHERP